MPDGRSGASPLASVADQGPQEVSADVRWRDAHELRSLLDMIAIYRQCVVDLAAQNTVLREEVAGLRASARTASLRLVAPSDPGS